MLIKWKKPILILIDLAIIYISYLITFYFRFQSDMPSGYFNHYLRDSIPIMLIYIIIFYTFRLYESLWRYAGIDEFLLCIGAGITANIASIIYGAVTPYGLPLSLSMLAGMLSIIYITGFRMSFRIYRRLTTYVGLLHRRNSIRVLIIGAGSAGIAVVNEMRLHVQSKYIPVGLIDDNGLKQGKHIAGVKVLGNSTKIDQIVKEKHIGMLIIAIPSLKREDKKRLLDICKRTGCRTKIMPSLYDLIDGKVSLKQVRDVEVEDLLGRESVKLDNEGIKEYISEKVVMITGGGGSIGSELCREIARFRPRQLLILDLYENNAYDLQNELKYKYPWLNMAVIIASIRDKKRLEKIFNEFKPEVVFHAAAHKHVPLMEDNPSEAIKNNIFGTLNLAECADKYETKRFVMISTDKAVNPTNIMGASKRVCEMIIQAINNYSRTEFVTVRFGNVLGSNGSVIPLFKRQIANGGPVTVTNKYITRYFMTIPEAAQLVLQAGAYAKGGEIFVLDMGKPVKIYDLACDLIRLSGFEPHYDIKIEITGLRPGEKLYEELLTAEEGLDKTEHEKIFVGKPTFSDIELLKQVFNEMRYIIENGTKEELIGKLQELVPTYKRVSYNEKIDGALEEVAQTIATTKLNVISSVS